MAEEKKETSKVEEVKETKKAEPKKEAKKEVKKDKKKEEVKVNTASKDFAKPTLADFDVIIAPVMTEKSMALVQNSNQATFKVKPNANKTSVKVAFERIFKVKATDVRILNVLPKETTRGGRYKGKINGYKKAIVTIEAGQAIDLFKE